MSEYAYSLPETGQQPVQPPAGSDPVDWFLFDSRVGGCNSFSTAFVVLARAAGVPARVVSGWAVGRYEGTQTVYGDQSHQWARLPWTAWAGSPSIRRREARLPGCACRRPPKRTPGTTTGKMTRAALPLRRRKPTNGWQRRWKHWPRAWTPELRAEAAALLGEIGGDAALQGLAYAVFLDPSEGVRIASLEAAAVWDFDLVVRVLHEHPDALMRIAAAELLGELSDDRALEPLSHSLRTDADGRVRAAAATALGELGKPGALGQLLDALGLDGESGVRAAAATALGKLEASPALVPLLHVRSQDESPAVRSAAATALEQWGLEQLESALLGSGYSAIREAAARVMGEHKDPDAAPPLIEARSDPEEGVREEAARALASLGTMTELEAGSALLAHSGGVSMVPGTTAMQASELPHVPVFQVSGASRTDFLRTAVGDHYIDGGWVADDPLKLGYRSNSPVTHAGPPGQPTTRAAIEHSERITLIPVEESQWTPIGVVPVSTHLETVSVAGAFRPRSATFLIQFPVSSYSWVSTVNEYSDEQLKTAQVSLDYTLLPENAPERVRDLAVRITAGHSTPYAKAKAIEQRLKTQYAYRLADPSGNGLPPAGHDPVDWFLFESREGPAGTSAAPLWSWPAASAFRRGWFPAGQSRRWPGPKRCTPTKPTSGRR